MKRAIFNNLVLMVFFLAAILVSCTQEEILPDQPGTQIGAVVSATNVTSSISNPGFESSFTGWTDVDPSSISGVARSGSKSAKISGNGGCAKQNVAVTANTDYELSAYIRGTGKLRAKVNGTNYSATGGGSDFTKVSVTFNSGSATTFEIWCEYNGSEGRFDDVELWETGSSSGGGGGGSSSGALSISSATASSNDGNGPANTIDGNLNTRWSANGNGQYLTLDLGSSQTVGSVDIAWFKGNERSATFEIWVGASTSSLTEVYSGTGSGSTLSLEEYDFADASGRYVRIIGFGNSSNSWNSITEVEIFGADGTGGSGGGGGGGGGGTGDYPTDVIPSLTDWKITLPVDVNGNDSQGASNVDNRNKNAHEIKDNNLIDYEYNPYFYAANNEVVFRAHCAGATTSGSKYPRSELRQRVGGGDNYWSVNDYQYLETEVRVTEVPVEKPEVSMVQIHGPSDEPLRVQYLAGTGVYIVWNESNKTTNEPVGYTLGDRLQVKVTVDNGDITCYLKNLDTNETYTRTWASSDNTGYFKVGCYTQSSIFLSEFKSGYSDEPLSAAGEVRVKYITLVENY